VGHNFKRGRGVRGTVGKGGRAAISGPSKGFTGASDHTEVQMDHGIEGGNTVSP